MRRLTATVIMALACLIVTSSAYAHWPAPGYGLKVVSAILTGGQIKVIGINAKKNADLFWEGNHLAHSNSYGKFQFYTTIVPSDCYGTLSDGYTTISVHVHDCTPMPPPPPPADPSTGVLKTGQTTCFNTSGSSVTCLGTGHDGELQKGTARSYTDNLNGTITDNATGLQWEKLDSSDLVVNFSNLHDADNFYSWDQAFAKIVALNTANFAGFSDWRLPNINELQTLADYGQINPAINLGFFNIGVDGTTYIYWSSTTYQGNTGSAWAVDFASGGVAANGKSGADFVRAVRGN